MHLFAMRGVMWVFIASPNPNMAAKGSDLQFAPSYAELKISGLPSI